jgi:hypothetical protein
MSEKLVKKPNEQEKENKKSRNKTEKKNTKVEARVDQRLHTKERDAGIKERITKFRTKLNKYGFIHVPKKATSSLPFEIEQPLEALIEGENLIFAKATDKQPQ